MREDFLKAREELNQIGIRRVVADFYMKPKRKGAVFFVKSPVTNDSVWSLAIYENNNRFYDFAGNHGGDIINLIAYTKGINQWQALKELRAYYGLPDCQEWDREEVKRKIKLQQQEQKRKAERRKAFWKAVFDEIGDLKHWEDIYSLAIEKQLYEPFSDMWTFVLNELQRTQRRLDVLCAANQTSYRVMKKCSDCIPSDYWQWLLDVLAILEEQGIFTATDEELTEIKAQRGCDVEW